MSNLNYIKNYLSKKNIEKIFLIGCAIWCLVYVTLSLSPSSYGIALNLFGIENETLLGTPKPVRSDEWAVWTPYLQMAVNNNFDRFYAMPGYDIDLRNFNILPLFDAMLFFKPFIWAYFIFEPSTAFSIYNALISITFLIGWHFLLKRIFSQIENIAIYAIGFSFILFFTGFTQYWFTTLGPIFALTPWLILGLLNKTKYRYLILFYISICWLVSHTYPPIIVQGAYLGLIFILITEKNWTKKIFIDYAIKAIVCLIATFCVIWYLYDVILIMSETIYPGKRIASGGDGFWQLWLSSFFPYIVIDGYKNLIQLNLSEIGTVSSLLPLVALCFINISKDIFLKKTSLLLLFAIFITSLWMFFIFPIWISKITLLYLVPADRALYILGILINLYSFYFIIWGRIRFNLNRYLVFSVLILFSYMLPSILGYISIGSKSGWELFSIPLLGFLFFINFDRKGYLIFSALIINLFYTFNFNPLQSTKPIFNIINSELINKVDFEKNMDGWITEPGYPGAILAGIGEKSFTNVLIQPQLKFFRSLFPNMAKSEFDDIFNRYAHIQLSLNDVKPYNPSPDVVIVPMQAINPNYPYLFKKIYLNFNDLPDKIGNLNIQPGGSVDAINFDGKILVLKGWALSHSNVLTLLTDEQWDVVQMNVLSRKDVADTISDKELKYSGFSIELKLNSSLEHNRVVDLCLISYDEKYGIRSLPSIENVNLYSCNSLYDK